MMSKQEVIQNEKENKMGYMPMNKLLIGMATPMIISMLLTAFYNIVDSIFVARIVDEEEMHLLRERRHYRHWAWPFHFRHF